MLTPTRATVARSPPPPAAETRLRGQQDVEQPRLGCNERSGRDGNPDGRRQGQWAVDPSGADKSVRQAYRRRRARQPAHQAVRRARYERAAPSATSFAPPGAAREACTTTGLTKRLSREGAAEGLVSGYVRAGLLSREMCEVACESCHTKRRPRRLIPPGWLSRRVAASRRGQVLGSGDGCRRRGDRPRPDVDIRFLPELERPPGVCRGPVVDVDDLAGPEVQRARSSSTRMPRLPGPRGRRRSRSRRRRGCRRCRSRAFDRSGRAERPLLWRQRLLVRRASRPSTRR